MLHPHHTAYDASLPLGVGTVILAQFAPHLSALAAYGSFMGGTAAMGALAWQVLRFFIERADRRRERSRR